MGSKGSKGAVVSLKKETEPITKITKKVVNKNPALEMKMTLVYKEKF